MNQEKKITYKVASLWVVIVALLVLALGAGIYYYIETSDANQAEIGRLNQSIQTLQANVNKLSASYSPAKLNTVRKDTDKIKQSLVKGEEADEFINKLKPVWMVRSRTEESNSEFIHRRYSLVRGSDKVNVWPEIYAVFKKMEEIPSLAVNRFEIKTLGDSNQRNFDQVTIEISVYVKKPE